MVSAAVKITNRDVKFFELALAAARTSRHSKAHIGAVVVSNKDVVSVGVNQRDKTHPMQKKYNVARFGFDSDALRHCTHAEIDALTKVKNVGQYKNIRVYVGRTMKNGELGMCRPCPACFNALKDHGINEIFYTTEHGFAHEVIVR